MTIYLSKVENRWVRTLNKGSLAPILLNIVFNLDIILNKIEVIMKVKELKKILESYDDDALVSFVRHGKHYAIMNHTQFRNELELSGPELSQFLGNMELFKDNSNALLKYCEDIYFKGITQDILIFCLEILLKRNNDNEHLSDVLSILYGFSPAHYHFPFTCIPLLPPNTDLLQT